MKLNKVLTILFIMLLFFSCRKEYTPKPEAYFRINLKTTEYKEYISNKDFSFYYSKNTFIRKTKNKNSENWENIYYPKLKATIHLSYKPVNEKLEDLLEDSRTFVYKHTVKAEAIEEQVFSNKEKNVYGIIYYLKGNTASSTQFIATDSNKHFMRGALYFNVHPNKDSLRPVVEYINKDIQHLMETLRWK